MPVNQNKAFYADPVLPNGTVTRVTQSTHPNLLWRSKGGFNTFVSHFPSFSHFHSIPLTLFQEIVTDSKMTTFPQSEAWVRTIHFTSFTKSFR